MQDEDAEDQREANVRTPDDFRRFCEMACEVADAIEREAFPRNLEYQYGCRNCEFSQRCSGSAY